MRRLVRDLAKAGGLRPDLTGPERTPLPLIHVWLADDG